MAAGARLRLGLRPRLWLRPWPWVWLGLAVAPAGHARAQALNLDGATPTLALTSQSPPNVLDGEQAWWPKAQAAQPFTAAGFGISLGMVGGGASPAPTGDGAYWSGWSDEAEAYPNQNALAPLAAAGISPIAVTESAIDLIATPMPASVAATLPSRFAGRPYLSGGFNTYPFGQEYGYFEITARVPSGKGLWPAFWMDPVAGTKTAEIDVSEILGGDTHVSYETIHTADPDWIAANPAPTYAFDSPVDLSAGYHRYGVDWGPTRITFYVDGTAVHAVGTPSDMHQPFYIIANLAVGTTGSWAGAPDATTTFPARFSLEKIAVWQRPAYLSAEP